MQNPNDLLMVDDTLSVTEGDSERIYANMIRFMQSGTLEEIARNMGLLMAIEEAGTVMPTTPANSEGEE